jgi:hypothetical protein
MGVASQNVTTGDLMPIIRAWRLNEGAPVICPACGVGHLDIADRSARPYREWYAVSCTTCGLDKTVSVPLAAPIPGVE